MPLKVLLFGTGAVGCTYAYILEKGGAEVTVVCRSNYAAIKENGITIRSQVFGNVSAKPFAVRSISEALEVAAQARGPEEGPETHFDYVLVCSKAIPGTAERIKPALADPTTTIVLAQNGIGIEEEYTKAYPNNSIISGVVYLPTVQVAPGVVEMGPFERLEIGAYPTDALSPTVQVRMEQLVEVWRAGGAKCTIFSDIQVKRWQKVAINAAWNPICALTRCDDANFIRSSPDAGDMVERIMKQVGKVAKAAVGFEVVTEDVIKAHQKQQTARLVTGGKEPSMLQDVRHGREIEVEAIVGNTLRIARRLGVQVPYLELLYILAKGLNFSLSPDERWQPILSVI